LRKVVDYFGPTKRVMALDHDSVKGLLRARRTGTHGFGKAGQQAVYNCFSALRSVILWAMKKKTASGTRLLTENPILGLSEEVQMNPTPVQPIISHETFDALRRAARKLPMYIRVFLILAEGTGRRAGAIRALEWSDVSFAEGEILWRGETDKMGHEMSRPASARVLRYLAVWKRYCPSQKYVFPAPKDPSLPVPKITVDKWPSSLYNAAGLKKPARAGWHSFRRKWATERDGYSLSILKEAGGWASSAALMRYLKTDRREVANAIQNPTRRV
jgi:integrase